MKNVSFRIHRDDFQQIAKLEFGEAVLGAMSLLKPSRGQLEIMDYSDAFRQAAEILSKLGLADSDRFYRQYPVQEFPIAFDVNFARDVHFNKDKLVSEISQRVSKRVGRILVLCEDGSIPIALWRNGILVDNLEQFRDR